MKTTDVAQKLGLNELGRRPGYVQGICALSGDGLYEGLDALEKIVKEFQQRKESSRF